MRLCIAIIVFTLNGALSFQKFHLGRRVGGNVRAPPMVLDDDPDAYYFTQTLDHFTPTDNRTFQQKYYVNDDFYEPGGPAFIYIDGEGAASTYWLYYGSMADSAKKYKAIVYELEHRYYGETRPTPDLSVENLKYLTSQQALADLAVFVEAINADLPQGTKWIAFGGSYAGALAAWFRTKYPHLIQGAVSHSGPILAKVNFEDYKRVVGESLAAYDPQCTADVKEAFAQIDASLQTSQGLETVRNVFKLCEPLNVNDKDLLAYFYDSLANYFSSIVQYDDGTNIRDLCDNMTTTYQGTAMERLQQVVDGPDDNNNYCTLYQYQYLVDYYKNDSWEGPPAEGMRQWIYQTCTEFGYYQTSTYPTHVFGNQIILDYFIHQCHDIFGPIFDQKFLEGEIDRTNTIYGGLDIKVSNVVYVHGSIDPWHALGILETVDEGAPAFYVKGVSHCAGMYSISSSDSAELRNAKTQVDSLIGQWLQQ